MSILTTIIQQNINNGFLIEYVPRPVPAISFRKLYITKDLFDELEKEPDDDLELQNLGELQANLAIFVNEQTLVVPGYIKWLDPKGCGMWELKCYESDPQLRTFCMFAEKDILIATHFADRDYLGPKGSNEWKTEMQRADHYWKTLFGSLACLKNTNVSKLFSGALNANYF